MNKSVLASLLILLVAGSTIAYLAFRSPEPPGQAILQQLRRQLAQQEIESDNAVQRYSPALSGRIDDLTLSAQDILRELPGVFEAQFRRPEGATRGT